MDDQGIKFDHSAQTARSGKFLIQNGELFSNSYYNRAAMKWEPEPQWISPEDTYAENRRQLPSILTRITRLLEEASRLSVVLDEMSTQAMESRQALENEAAKVRGTLGHFRAKVQKLEEEKEGDESR